MKKIYVSSQFFGFGPTSNLFSILKNLKNKSDSFEIHAFKNEVMELFSERSPGIIDQWSEEEMNYTDLDILLSSFDPFTVVEAWFKDIPSIFYCNLFWYWDVFDKKDKMLDHKKKLDQLKQKNNFSSAKNLFLKIFNNNPHEGIFLGYMLSTHCFTRNFYGIDKLFNIYQNEMNMSFCDIFIPYQLKQDGNNKNTVLIQLSGGRNGVVTSDENICYMQLCIQLSKHLANSYSGLEIIICANPIILDQTNLLNTKLPNNVKIIPSVSQEKNLSMMENALALFTSPGLETIYEAIYCNCPVFLLPEQNAGQYSIFQLLNATGFNPKRFLINEYFPERAKRLGEEDAHEIYKIIQKNILPHENLYHLCELSLAFIENMMREKERKAYLEMSLNSLKFKSKKSPFTINDTVSDFIINHYA